MIEPATLRTPYPLIRFLPALFADDPFAVRFTGGFDDVLATMVNPIDCVQAYVDPLLAPEPFVDWLASWVGVVLDETWTPAARRAVVAEAVDLFRMRGTMAGLRRHLDVVVDGDVAIIESGGVSVSERPRPDPPNDVEHWVRVQVRPRTPGSVSQVGVEAVIRAAKPVHVMHSVEVIP